MTSDSAPPLTQGEFAELVAACGDLPPQGPWALAVSGGPDSMALAFCAHRWFKAHEEPEAWPSVRMLTQALRLFMPFQPALSHSTGAVAFIVDHGLRANSQEESALTRERLGRIGIHAEILRWEHAPVRSRIHARAREARYRLMIEACKRLGVAHLLIAHQMEDQAETVMMRLAKGSGVDGLAGIPFRSELDGVTVWRPFLRVPRARLAATCAANGVDYVVDPSNASEAYARGRLRRVIPLLEQEGLSIERLADLADRAQDAREALTVFRDEVMREAASFDDFGAARIQLDALRHAPRDIALRVVAAIIRTIHAGAYAPERASLLRLLESLRGEDAMSPCTLHGCLFVRASSHATIVREHADISEFPSIRPGESLMWDGRWAVRMDYGFSPPSMPAISHDAFAIRPLGTPDHATLDRLAPELRRRAPQGRVRASLPSLWREGRLVAIPTFGAGDSRAASFSATLRR